MKKARNIVHELFALQDEADALKECIQDAVWAYNAWDDTNNPQAAAAVLHSALKRTRALQAHIKNKIDKLNKRQGEGQNATGQD